jgi:hypothetical protein
MVADENEHSQIRDDTPFAMGETSRYSITKEFAGSTVLVTGETRVSAWATSSLACQQLLLLALC